MLPVIVKSIGCCATTMMDGSIRWIFIGHKYQLNWSIVAKIWLKESLHLWPTSQMLNAIPIARHNWTMDAATINGLLSSRDWNYNKNGNATILKRETQFLKKFIRTKKITKLIPFVAIASMQRSVGRHIAWPLKVSVEIKRMYQWPI